MKRFTYVLLLALSLPCFADNVVVINADEVANVGIEVGKLQAVNQAFSKKLPAKVTIPNKSQRVVSAPQGGVIELMLVAEGDHVIAGQELAYMNSPQLLASQNNYLQALSTLAQTKREMLRDKALFEEKIIAERRYRQSQTLYQQSKTEVAMYRKALELAGMKEADIALLNKTRSLTSYLTVAASSSGVVMKQFATVGQRLTAADPLYQIAQLSPLWLEIHVPLKIANQVQIDEQVMICNKSIEGHVIAIGREVHEADQGVLVRAEVSQKTEQLTPGEFVEVCFIKQKDGLQFIVPRSAVFRFEGRPAVFVETEKGFIYQPVEIVTDNGEQLIIKGALSVDQNIVIAGTATLKATWLGMGGE